MKRALWIAIDLDGTAWSHTFFFGEIARALQARGHKVGILTSHNERLRFADIDLWGRRGFPPPDFYICKTDAEASIPAAEWKPEMMRKHRIDWLFDDLDTGAIRLLTTETPER
jgi:hypothetical protein